MGIPIITIIPAGRQREFQDALETLFGKHYTIHIYDDETDVLMREIVFCGSFEELCRYAESHTDYDEYWLWS